MYQKLNSDPIPIFNFGKYPKIAIAYKEFFYKSKNFEKHYQKASKKLTLFFFRTAYHPHVIRKYSYVIRMSLCIYSYVTRMSLVCGSTMNLSERRKNKETTQRVQSNKQ